MALEIFDDEMDSANVTVVTADEEGARVAPREDPEGGFAQWFAFRTADRSGQGGRIALDTSAMTYPEALEGYRVFAAFDGGDWQRIETDSACPSELVFWHPEGVARARFALWEPYPEARRKKLLARVRRAHNCSVAVIGRSLDGAALCASRVGGGPLSLWVTARQHPGEVMAEWFAEGLLERLTNTRDAAARALRRLATVMVVSCANPDGAARGHHRVNAAGVDMNRSWLRSEELDDECPEVLALRDALEDTGVDYFLDVHGDERTAMAFAARSEGNPSYTDDLAEREARFVERLATLCEQFDRESGYPLDAPGEADLSTAQNYVGERFECPSLTLELPFKGAGDGWTSGDARALGAAAVEALLAAVDEDEE
jgi:murein tripeptide amidase MpaA